MSKSSKVKRYNLTLPEELFDEIQQISDEEHTTMVEVFRRFIKLGLLVTEVQKKPDAQLIIREGDTEKHVVFL